MSSDGDTGALAPRALSVAALLLAAADALQFRLGAVAVRGELSGFSRAASGHCYFSLKDSDGASALLRCAMFRRAASLLDFAPRDGQHVEVRGRVGIYEPRGELQCIVEAMLPLGAGSLYELFLRQKAKLEAAGLFDDTRKRPLAQHPRAIGWATQRAEVDTLIVCRGGGSLEDLWAFNDEAVVRAIAASTIPVVCG
ncbi:MAG TPA: exodeoxyribonuclease VII large subunit, partial [Burkholderiaceae bacterium]|nr:exodeoxyribonuclease VII large subunit [Burkholderiaceae bacterium]